MSLRMGSRHERHGRDALHLGRFVMETAVMNSTATGDVGEEELREEVETGRVNRRG